MCVKCFTFKVSKVNPFATAVAAINKSGLSILFRFVFSWAVMAAACCEKYRSSVFCLPLFNAFPVSLNYLQLLFSINRPIQ